MVVGRMLAGISRALIFTPGGYSMAVWVNSCFISSLPGIAIHLILIPAVILALEKAKLIPVRYSKRV